MSVATAASAANHWAAYIDGQAAASRFIQQMFGNYPGDDKLHAIVRTHTAHVSPESDAFLCTFLHFVQKRLELLS